MVIAIRDRNLYCDELKQDVDLQFDLRQSQLKAEPMSGQARRLPTLSQVLTLDKLDVQGTCVAESQTVPPREQKIRAEQEWYAAIAALNQLLYQNADAYSVAVCDGATPVKGVVLSGPAPILESPALSEHFADWVLTSEPAQVSLQLPANLQEQAHEPARVVSLPISQSDPIIAEQFCLVLTADFCLVLTLGQPQEEQVEFQFSFNPAIVERAWQTLRIRLSLTSPHQVQQMETYIQQFAPVEPDYQLVMQFQRLMLKQLPMAAASLSGRGVERGAEMGTRLAIATAANHQQVAQAQVQANRQANGQVKQEGHFCDRATAKRTNEAATASNPLSDVASSLSLDAELLRAMAHEIRTPLTTIRTLTRSLMRRTELGEKVLYRLKQIDQECTQQIDRFGLIFRAVELETQQSNPSMGSLSAIALDQVFQESIPRWQQQAQQRNIQLDVTLPHTLPWVVSDPVMLNQVLTNLIERFALSLPSGSHLQLGVMPAGHQLKLQFKSSLPDAAGKDGLDTDDFQSSNPYTFANMAINPQAAFKSLGQLLMVQPETGNLSLNLSATKNLFQALGGKLIVKQRPKQGEVMTIFLPLDLRQHQP